MSSGSSSGRDGRQNELCEIVSFGLDPPIPIKFEFSSKDLADGFFISFNLPKHISFALDRNELNEFVRFSARFLLETTSLPDVCTMLRCVDDIPKITGRNCC